MTEEHKYLEIETKYSADDIDRLKFKDLANSLNPKSFIYVESTDIYFVRSESEFLRYRMPAQNINTADESRSELTFKKKHKENNNWKRTEVNLRVDLNDPKLVEAFCEGLDYKKSFTINKGCDIYVYDKVNLAYYFVKGEDGKYSNFLEIEALEDIGMTPEESWEEVVKYEKLLANIGISPQKRMRLSLFELYSRG
jgi:adenylate cyclase class IV